MSKGLVIADSGPLFSLAFIDQLNLLHSVFADVFIPRAVWNEITYNESTKIYPQLVDFFKDKIHDIEGFNDLTFIMDWGESEAVLLYKELQADFLLIDDKKAHQLAENLSVNCIGTIGLLSVCKDKGLIAKLRPMFVKLLANKRYYSVKLLNDVLKQKGEKPIR